MKKIFLGIILFLFTPLIVNAADYDITDFLVEAQILDNGDLEVNELIVLDGSFNGYERDILYANEALEEGTSFANNIIYNATNVTNMLIGAKYVENVSFDTFTNSSFDNFTKVNYAENGTKAKYIESDLINGYRYRMYYKTSNNKVAFYLKYTLKDVVVMHEDVAELYWTFVPSGFLDDIKNIKIKVYLPKSDNSDKFRIWAHGNLNGKVSYIDKKGIYAEIDEVFSGESVDIRTTFDKNLITDPHVKKSNVVALEKIIEVETKRAEVANNLRADLLAKYNFVKYSTLTLYGAIVLLTIFIYFKYGKSPKSNYYSKYNREFIEDYNVEVIDYLMNKKITPNAMSASIMNLIYKKNIKAEEIAGNNKKKKEYLFTLENSDNVNESEVILIDFLFDKVGKGKLNIDNKKIFTTKDLKSYAKGTKTCDTFITSYTKWKNNVLDLGKSERFYETNIVPKIIGIITMCLSFFIFAFGMNYEVDYLPTYLLLFIAIIFFIYSLIIDKKTPKGREHYDKWNAFKNFLDDFGSFELKELPEIILWERYLVYATIFGLADKVQKSINVKIKEIDINSLDYDYYPSFVYVNIGSTINSSINNALNSAYNTQAANYANSHSSSSSGGGFGGGFSSGGGFGGGGGGGRGF